MNLSADTPHSTLAKSPPSDSLPMPEALKTHLNGESASVVAWACYDVDEDGMLAEQFLVLRENALCAYSGGQRRVFELETFSEARIIEGIGIDRLVVRNNQRTLGEFAYSHRCRREMTRLHRKIERRLPDERGLPREKTPDWLDAVERQIEQKEICSKCGQPIPSYAEGVCPQCLHKRSVLWRLLKVAHPYKRQIYLALALTLLLVPVGAVGPVLNRNLIDLAIGATAPAGERLHALFFWGGLMLATILLTELLNGSRMFILTRLGTLVARDLRHAVYAHLHDLSLRYFSKRRTGSLITRVTNDTDRLWDFVVFGSVNLVRDALMIVVFSTVMFWMNWRLALIALIPLPLLAVITYWRGMRMQRMFYRLWTYWSRMTAVVGDAIPGIRVVKAFANESREISRFDRRSDEYARKEQQVNVVWTQLQPVVSGTMMLGHLLVFMVGGYLVIAHGDDPSGKNTLGTLVAFTQFLWRFYMPIMELANSNRLVTRAASSAQRVFEVLDTPPEIYSRPNAVQKPLVGQIEFRNVSFSYEGAQPALRDVSLAVEPGEMIGLCGPSGAGKTTLVNLVCRFYDPIEGQILLDGVDLRDYDVQWLRRQIGVVLQEPYLFHGTVAENIRYGSPDATADEIIRAAKAANAHDFIVSFPDGYDTIVGERGQSLSGGERQRISIARAILHDPRILILDEATSSVDTETEKQIQQALDRLVEGRTTVAIAHRLSTLQAADRLVVLEKGRVVEMGHHSELLRNEEGVYAKLHKTQAEMNMLVAIR